MCVTFFLPSVCVLKLHHVFQKRVQAVLLVDYNARSSYLAEASTKHSINLGRGQRMGGGCKAPRAATHSDVTVL